jgi:hypothetical protein
LPCRIPPCFEIRGEPELREFVGDGHRTSGGNLVEFIPEAETIIEYTYGEIVRFGARRVGAGQAHGELVMPVVDDALLAPGLFPAQIHGLAAFVGHPARRRVAESLQHQAEPGLRDHRLPAAKHVVERTARVRAHAHREHGSRRIHANSFASLRR